MSKSVLVLVGQAAQNRLSDEDRYKIEARQVLLETFVAGLRKQVSHATAMTINPIASSLCVGILCSDDEYHRLKQHFNEHPQEGRVLEDSRFLGPAPDRMGGSEPRKDEV